MKQSWIEEHPLSNMSVMKRRWKVRFCALCYGLKLLTDLSLPVTCLLVLLSDQVYHANCFLDTFTHHFLYALWCRK